MIPSPTERDDLFKHFARALFKGDMEALYQVVTPDFLWSFHDGLAVTKSLQGPDCHRANSRAEAVRQSIGDDAIVERIITAKLNRRIDLLDDIQIACGVDQYILQSVFHAVDQHRLAVIGSENRRSTNIHADLAICECGGVQAAGVGG